LYYHINIGTVKVTTTFKLALYYHNFLYYFLVLPYKYRYLYA